MKTIYRTFELKIIRPPVYIFLVWLTASSALFAQHQHHATIVPVDKNIYIAMMDTMMADMDKAPVGNTPDTAFLQQMLPHHKGALAMAEYEITHGKNTQMIQLAKSIFVEQKSEIEQMQLWLKQAHPLSAKLPEFFMAAMGATMKTMMSAMPKETELSDTDRAFAAVMKPHHQAAIDMARVLLQYSNTTAISAYARQIIANQQTEIIQMSNFLNSK
jgi:uncharacterized protein (DUF305 family)